MAGASAVRLGAMMFDHLDQAGNSEAMLIFVTPHLLRFVEGHEVFQNGTLFIVAEPALLNVHVCQAVPAMVIEARHGVDGACQCRPA
jgi:hypothetical protein